MRKKSLARENIGSIGSKIDCRKREREDSTILISKKLVGTCQTITTFEYLYSSELTLATMKFSTIVSSLCLLATARSAFADEPEAGLEPLLETPTKLWSAQLFPDVNIGSVEIEGGNGVFMAPDGIHALVTTVGATVYSFNAYTGEQAWVYQPAPIPGNIARSHSGVVFGPEANYMVYGVVDNEFSTSPSS